MLLAVSIAFADWQFYKNLETVSFDYSLIERTLIAAQALWFYVGKLLLPVGLAVIYPHWDVTDALGWSSLLAAILVVALLGYFRHQIGRGPLAGALFFIVTLSPVLGFVDYGFMQFSFVADRYQYLASVGIIAALVGSAAHYLGSLSTNSQHQPNSGYKFVPILLAIPLTILATLTWQQASIYHNPGTFFRHIAALNPQARLVHYNLGNYLRRQGRTEDTLAAYRMALQQEPNSTKASNAIGVVFDTQGQFKEAQKYYRLSLQKIRVTSTQCITWREYSFCKRTM